MRRALQSLLVRAMRKLNPPPDIYRENRFLKDALDALVSESTVSQRQAAYMEHVAELIEARQMAGSGPWRVSPSVIADTDAILERATQVIAGTKLREAAPLSQGALGDIELALQNVEWRREVNLSWLEFSRWGVQQIILISRLYYVKNPLIQRGVNLAAAYVFGRGVEISSSDEAANDAIQEFLERNSRVLGQVGLAELHKRGFYDGQIFFTLFADTQSAGTVDVRTIDATEIQQIITDPGDTDTPWFYRREWSEKTFDVETGAMQTTQRHAWYPALGYDPAEKPPMIGDAEVMWQSPVIHMKGGTGVSKWHFDVPKVYAALDWARTARNMLEWTATVKKSLAQISMTLTTKGGQQALAGAKGQLGSTVGPSSSIWDTNPTATPASIFASGPGTKLEAFKTAGAGGDPGEVKEYRNMVACVLEIPPTWLGDMETSNLSTATTLDRPTELGFIEKQERWRPVLIAMVRFALGVSAAAPSGKLREALHRRKLSIGTISIREARRKQLPSGRWIYEAEKPKRGTIDVKVTFPAIREGDTPALIKSVVEAMTLDNKGGQVTGIDEKVGVLKLLELIGIEDAQDIVEQMYPDGEYDPDRTQEPLPAPIPKALPDAGGRPQLNQQGQDPAPPTQKQREAARRLVAAVKRANGDARHVPAR